MKGYKIKNQTYHFYASSVSTWVTTTDTRSLLDLLKLMEAEGLPYNLFYLPVSHETSYQIKSYQPEVEGAVYLGAHYPKLKKAKAA